MGQTHNCLRKPVSTTESFRLEANPERLSKCGRCAALPGGDEGADHSATELFAASCAGSCNTSCPRAFNAYGITAGGGRPPKISGPVSWRCWTGGHRCWCRTRRCRRRNVPAAARRCSCSARCRAPRRAGGWRSKFNEPTQCDHLALTVASGRQTEKAGLGPDAGPQDGLDKITDKR